MKAPEINIKFIEAAKTVPFRVDKGTVLLLVNEMVKAYLKNPVTVLDTGDIPEAFSDVNKDFVKLALKGYGGESPKKVIVYMTNIPALVNESQLSEMTVTDILALAESNGYDLSKYQASSPKDTVISEYLNVQTAAETANLEKTLKNIAKIKFTYLAYPEASESTYAKVTEWIIEQRAAGNRVKAVLPNIEGDDEGIINYVNTKNVVSEAIKSGKDTVYVKTEYTAEQFTPRIAGLLAAIPSNYSATYAVLEDMVDCDEIENRDEAVNAGKFFVFNDGEKIKTCRAVNSLQTVPDGKSEDFKKIRIVHIMDTINSDITKLVEDEYIGKYPNTYDSKCILITAISEYLAELESKGMLQSHTVDIDITAQKEYLKEKGYDVSEMTNEEIKQALTGTKVFVSGTAAIVDAIEDITWNIYV